MASKYTLVLIQWPEGTFPNAHLSNLTRQKSIEFVDSGKSVSGELPTSDHKADLVTFLADGTNKTINYGGNFDTHKDHVKYGPVMTNLKHDVDLATNTVTSYFPAGEVIKNVRLFTTVDAANEWIEFALTIGALSASILTENEYKDFITLPPDEIIDQYVTKV